MEGKFIDNLGNLTISELKNIIRACDAKISDKLKEIEQKKYQTRLELVNRCIIPIIESHTKVDLELIDIDMIKKYELNSYKRIYFNLGSFFNYEKPKTDDTDDEIDFFDPYHGFYLVYKPRHGSLIVEEQFKHHIKVVKKFELPTYVTTRLNELYRELYTEFRSEQTRSEGDE